VPRHRALDIQPPGRARDALADALHQLHDAERQDQPAILALALAQVGRCYRRLGDGATAEWYLQQGLRKARTMGAPEACIELLCDLAELVSILATEIARDEPRAAHAIRERARDHGYEATQMAGLAGDWEWEAAVLQRVSRVLERCGDSEDAEALRQRAAALQARDLRTLHAANDASTLARAAQ
jgi:predicted transcriptional regulator